MNKNSSGKYLIAGLVLLLIVLHQDNWFWEDDTLVMGIMPIGLFYHACISIAASVTWFLATKFAWPLEDVETTHSSRTSSAEQGGVSE